MAKKRYKVYSSRTIGGNTHLTLVDATSIKQATAIANKQLSIPELRGHKIVRITVDPNFINGKAIQKPTRK